MWNCVYYKSACIRALFSRLSARHLLFFAAFASSLSLSQFLPRFHIPARGPTDSRTVAIFFFSFFYPRLNFAATQRCSLCWENKRIFCRRKARRGLAGVTRVAAILRPVKMCFPIVGREGAPYLRGSSGDPSRSDSPRRSCPRRCRSHTCPISAMRLPPGTAIKRKKKIRFQIDWEHYLIVYIGPLRNDLGRRYWLII